MAIKKTGAIGSASLLLLVMALGKYFLNRATEHRKEKDRQLMAQISYNTQQDIYDGRRAIDSLLKARGTVFLYSNDTAAMAGWVPNTGSYETGGVTSLILEASALKEFAEKQDSLGYSLVVRHSKVFLQAQKARLFNSDSTARRIWFMAYDSQDRLPKDSNLVRRYPHVYGGPFWTSWGLGFDKAEELRQQLEEDWILKGMLTNVQRVEGFYLYMVAAEQEDGRPSVNEEAFAAAVRMLNRRLHRAGIDTMQFRARICRRDGAPDPRAQ